MYYAPQPWLADWSALTNEIVRANEEGEDEMPRGSYERKERTAICQRCGAEFTAKSDKAKWCPPCNTRVHIERSNRIRAARKAAAAVTSVDLAGRTHDMSAADVPDVPTDDYYSIEDRIKKTAPIETVLVPKKGDKEMDTERAERLKTFPSMSNRLEHPEYFTGDTPESLGQTKTVPDDYGTTKDVEGININEKMVFDAMKKQHHSLLEEITSDKKRMLLGLYDGMSDLCTASGMTFDEMLDRMSRLHAALS